MRGFTPDHGLNPTTKLTDRRRRDREGWVTLRRWGRRQFFKRVPIEVVGTDRFFPR